MSTGALQTTGNPLDVAIQGDGSFFRVGERQPGRRRRPITNVQYTRAGNFTRNEQGYLVTQDGQYVVGRTAAGGGTDTLLQVPTGATNVAIDQDGSVSYATRPAAAPA